MYLSVLYLYVLFIFSLALINLPAISNHLHTKCVCSLMTFYHFILVVFALKGQRKWSSAPSIRNPEVNEERMRPGWMSGP